MARNNKDRNIIVDAARHQLDEFIRLKGMRRTPERYTILAKIITFDKLFSIDDIMLLMESQIFRVCKATVYNAVQTFCQAGILRKHSYNNTSVKYELALKTGGNVHLICTVCGSVKVSNDPEIDAILRHRRFKSFAHRFYSLHVYGLCTRCRRLTQENELSDIIISKT